MGSGCCRWLAVSLPRGACTSQAQQHAAQQLRLRRVWSLQTSSGAAAKASVVACPSQCSQPVPLAGQRQAACGSLPRLPWVGDEPAQRPHCKLTFLLLNCLAPPCPGELPPHGALRHRQAAVHRARGRVQVRPSLEKHSAALAVACFCSFWSCAPLTCQHGMLPCPSFLTPAPAAAALLVPRSGQYIYCGKKATLNIGNVKPVRALGHTPAAGQRACMVLGCSAALGMMQPSLLCRTGQAAPCCASLYLLPWASAAANCTLAICCCQPHPGHLLLPTAGGRHA